jgi:hypothetical protein
MVLNNSSRPILAQPSWWDTLVNFTFFTRKENKRPFDQFRGQIIVTGLDLSGKTTFLHQCFEEQVVTMYPDLIGSLTQLRPD